MTDTYNLDRRPPCWLLASNAQTAARQIYIGAGSRTILTGLWAGWRLAGRDLVHRAANGSQNAGCADCSGMRMPPTSGLRCAGGTPNEKRFSSHWSRSSSWILANGESGTSARSQDKTLAL